ncbi:PREDICTED: probable 37S ribosomal protein S28, mitochondrial [Camelina sativa]|uniref:Small ribosomal subunit protein uS15c n=1 Tax=Camelina sativa TaxID=90675 RepID=A0ABM0VP68_CAMSA|nr:PREDICTED: probable 37S ribosomal protein S28, mitochondrial [Camelina sativa]
MALHLARRQQRLPSNPYLIRLFSNSSSDSPSKVANASVEKSSQSPSSPSPSDSSPFFDIKTTLKQKLQNQQEQGRRTFPRSDAQSQNRGPISFSGNQSRVSQHDLGKNLAKFQRRSTVPPPRDPSQSPPQVSFEALFNKQKAAPNSSDPRNRKAQSFDSSTLLANLKNLRTQPNTSNNIGKRGSLLGNFKSTGGEAMPMSPERREGETEDTITEFLTFYNEEELGEKLRMLRPEGDKQEGWFSLQELNQRLVKLRQVEEKEAQSRTKNFAALRNVISSIKNDSDKNEVLTQQNVAIMCHLGGTPEYKLLPPKEELVETYFHPDNMSSAEKMKIELTKVREELKMSESDCGSARVQVAQLTTKIKHLSSSLHKKDKHSRKGLLGMVQKRKKLLKYLRRTDWNSYCLVLSKLSLRDNPEYKL